MSFFFDMRRPETRAAPFPDEWLACLKENVLLYRLLSDAEQAKLRHALRHFVAEKFWEGCAGLRVTDEMKVTIAAQACLLVLGFDDYCFDELRTILIYPGGYLGLEADSAGGETRVQHRLGEAHERGPVVLSWWEVRWAGRRLGQTNLVLHEFAHKLAEFGDPATGTPPIEEPELSRRWETVMAAEYERLADDAHNERWTLLDPYGATNRAEFFAVATETFFLQPAALRRQHPSLYQLLGEWYRQDPSAWRTDKAIAEQAKDAEEEYARHVIAECSSAIRQYPDYLDGYSQRAGWYCHVGEFKEAIADYTMLIQRAEKGDRAAAYFDRGSAHLEAEAYEPAIADFTEAIRRAPEFAAAYRCRGSARAARGERRQALADLTQALRLDPRDHSAYVERALVYHDGEQYDKALRDLGRALRLGADAPTVHGYRAQVHLASKDYDHAIADCDEALRLEGTFAEAYKHRGVANHYKGAYEQAITDLSEAIRLDPTYAEAYRARALSYQARGEEEKARSDCAQARELESNGECQQNHGLH